MSPPRYTTGWVYNLDTAPQSTDAGRVIALAISFSTISLLCIISRVITRMKILKGVGLDDVSAAASMVIGVAYSAVAIYRTHFDSSGTAHMLTPLSQRLD
jgi:hypothetical protein